MNKDQELITSNPNGTVPSLITRISGVEHRLYDSLEVMQIFDALGTQGVQLFPSNLVLGAKLRNRIGEITAVARLTYTFLKDDPAVVTPEHIQNCKNLARKLDKRFEGKVFVADDITGTNEISAADFAVFPFFESWIALKDTLLSNFLGDVDLPNLTAWYNRMAGLPFI